MKIVLWFGMFFLTVNNAIGQVEPDFKANQGIAKYIDNMKTLKVFVDTSFEGLCNPSVAIDTTFYRFYYDTTAYNLLKVIVVNHKKHIEVIYYFKDDYLIFYKTPKSSDAFLLNYDYGYANNYLDESDPIWAERNKILSMAYKFLLAFKSQNLSNKMQTK